MLNNTLLSLIEITEVASNNLLNAVSNLTDITNTTYTYLFNNVGVIRGQLTVCDALNNINATTQEQLLGVNQIASNTRDIGQIATNTRETVSALSDLEVSVSGAVVVTNSVLHPALNVVFEA